MAHMKSSYIQALHRLRPCDYFPGEHGRQAHLREKERVPQTFNVELNCVSSGVITFQVIFLAPFPCGNPHRAVFQRKD